MADDASVVGGATVEPQAPLPEPVASAEPVAEPEAKLEPAKAPEPPRWALERIAEERRKGEEVAASERTARQQAEARAAELQAIIDRLQAEPGKSPAASTPPREATTGRFVSRDDPAFKAEVQAEAARQLFLSDCTEVGNRGGAEFANWAEILRVLEATKANADDVLADVIAVDKANAHRVLAQISENPERAMQLAKMNSRQRIVELTRMTAQTEKPAEPAKADAPATPQSRAPTPKPIMAPTNPVADVDPRTPDGNEKMDDAQWQEWYRRTYMKKAG